MSDKNTYARRSQRHKQEPDICENTNQLNEAVKSKPETKTNNQNTEEKSNYSKYIFALFTAHILVIVATGGYIVYTLKQQK